VKAIIIQDADAKALLDKLKLTAFEEVRIPSFVREGLDPEAFRRAATEAIHARFHFVVCRWLQDQGADVVR
jgi:hypothetical protein